ncbi:MAG: aminotransferase class I/II-fold pyridoxal phosphate-dependent enzyme [Planctomycetes bacterium]|nr:aminotransferase class I/II-fold pyridoxal phosphate-dependent enzyme [Planctomycetota bacterium]
MVAHRLRPFGTTIFSRMTQLALQFDAVNLSQGFPDFEGPPSMIRSVESALRSGANQYARSQGHPELVEAVAAMVAERTGLAYDPMREVAVFHGATEAIAATILGLLDPDDEVILFEPYYDSYPACCAMAGASPRFVTLSAPRFRLERSALEAAFNDRTRLLVLNTPHNPTGRVLTEEELDLVAELCHRYDVVVLADEVYERLTFDGAKHLSIATRPGMRERTITVSSCGKTFSFTGWKIGWATGDERWIAAAQAAHQFLTFCSTTPLQVGVARALRELPDSYYDEFRSEYGERRALLIEALTDTGFVPIAPEGTYFILAGFRGLSDEDDQTFAERWVRECGVAAIPPSVFYSARPERGLLRFAFCKRRETLEEAARRMLAWRRGERRH